MEPKSQNNNLNFYLKQFTLNFLKKKHVIHYHSRQKTQ